MLVETMRVQTKVYEIIKTYKAGGYNSNRVCNGILGAPESKMLQEITKVVDEELQPINELTTELIEKLKDMGL